jgi:Carbamoyltransferase N-terminus
VSPTPECILGISPFCDDSAARVLRDEDLIAAASEERLTRKKGDARFPEQAVADRLREAGVFDCWPARPSSCWGQLVLIGFPPSAGQA